MSIHRISDDTANAGEQLARFFADNPDEELTIEGTSQKFGVSTRTAANILSNLKGKGVLERVSIYRVKTE